MSTDWEAAVVIQLVVAVALGVVLPLVLAFVFMIMSAAMSDEAKAAEYRTTLKANVKKWIANTIGFFVLVFALADGAILAAPHMWAGYLRLLAWMGVHVLYPFIAAGVVGIGYGAFQFKEHHKKWYGRVEVIFSGVSVVVALMTTRPDNRVGLVITIIGAMYVSSRGFGNWLGKSS